MSRPPLPGAAPYPAGSMPRQRPEGQVGGRPRQGGGAFRRRWRLRSTLTRQQAAAPPGPTVLVRDPFGVPLSFYYRQDNVARQLQSYDRYHGAAVQRLDHVNCFAPAGAVVAPQGQRPRRGSHQRSRTAPAPCGPVREGRDGRQQRLLPLPPRPRRPLHREQRRHPGRDHLPRHGVRHRSGRH